MASVALPKLGISLDALKAFISSSRVSLEGLSTAQVCALVIKPLTQDTGKSYCELYEGTALVGVPTVFVSHAWSHCFLDVVAALLQWAGRQSPEAPSPVYWFDVFSNPQHGTVDRPFEWWNTVFTSSVGEIHHTLLVLRWEDLNSGPLTRAWCLVEIVATLQTCSKLDVVMSPVEEAKFTAALLDNFTTVVDSTCAVDVETSSAYHGASCRSNPHGLCADVISGAISACPDDRSRILTSVRTGIGFFETNKRVKERMREWMADAGRAALQGLPTGSRSLSALLPNVAHLLSDLGYRTEAEALYREALAGAEALGLESAEALAALNNLAVFLQDGGELVSAESLFERAMSVHQRRGDSGTPEASLAELRCMLNLGRVKRDLGQFDVAAPLLYQALKGFRSAVGTDDHETLAALTSCALLESACSRPDAAEALFREALEGYRRIRVRHHPEILLAMENVAQAQLVRGRLVEAEILFREALEGQRLTLGDRHPDTLMGAMNVGLTLQNRGAYVDAAPLLREALEGCRNTLRPGHPRTLLALRSMAALFVDLGDLAAAEPLLRDALGDTRCCFGREHPDTLRCLMELAELLVERGDFEAAEPLFVDAIETASVFDAESAEVARARHGLLACFSALGKDDGIAAQRALIDARSVRLQLGPHEHPLQRIVAVGCYPGSKATCDACSRQRLSVDFHCGVCCFDLCEPCFVRTGSNALTFAPHESVADAAGQLHEGDKPT